MQKEIGGNEVRIGAVRISDDADYGAVKSGNDPALPEVFLPMSTVASTVKTQGKIVEANHVEHL